MHRMSNDPWLTYVREHFQKQKASILKATSQLTDEELFRRPAPGFNSVAIIIRHISGNLLSRFTDFLTSDGEKPNRDRENEFADWTGTRAELFERFDQAFATLLKTIDLLTDSDLDGTIYIRSQPLAVRDALLRAVDHLAGHVGQIVYLSRLTHQGDWNWLSIAPGKSADFNKRLGHQ